MVLTVEKLLRFPSAFSHVQERPIYMGMLRKVILKFLNNWAELHSERKEL